MSTITTAAELKALPVHGSVVRDQRGIIWVTSDGLWSPDSAEDLVSYEDMGDMVDLLPLTVLYRPDQQPTAADAVHFLAINSDWDEPRLKLVCTAARGASCHKQHPDPTVEEFYPDDPDLIDTDTCWAVEWAEDGGWETVAVKEGAVFPMIPVHITNDEGPVVEPIEPHPLLPKMDAIKAEVQP